MQARGNSANYPKQCVSSHLFIMPKPHFGQYPFIPRPAARPESPRDMHYACRITFHVVCCVPRQPYPDPSDRTTLTSFSFLQRPKLCDKWFALGSYPHAQHGSILQDLWMAFHASGRLLRRLPYIRPRMVPRLLVSKNFEIPSKGFRETDRRFLRAPVLQMDLRGQAHSTSNRPAL